MKNLFQALEIIFVRALATEIENKEEYEFLKGNKELEAIFSQYLK